MQPIIRPLLPIGACAALMLALSAPSTPAASVDRAAIGADAGWALHLDVDAFRGTGLGKQVLAVLKTEEREPVFQFLKTILSFDPRDGLHGLTLYGRVPAPNEAVAMIYADLDAEKLTAMAAMAEDYRTIPHGTQTIHHWVDNDRREKEGGDPRTYAAIYQGRILIFSRSEKGVASALDVLSGTRPGLPADGKFSHLGHPGAGVFIQAAAAKLETPDKNFVVSALQKAEQAWLEVRDEGGKIGGSLVVQARQPQAAGQFADLLGGVGAMLRLQADNPIAVGLGSHLTSQATDREAAWKLALPETDMFKWLDLPLPGNP